MSSTLESLKRVRDRVEQTVCETVGTASRTELDKELRERMDRAEEIRHHVEAVLGALEKHIPHDARLISSFSSSCHSADGVAQSMREFGRAIEKWPAGQENSHFVDVFGCADDVFKTLSRSEKTYVENAAIHFLAPMKFLTADMKKFEYEKKCLLTARVDMDFALNRAAKTENEQNTLEAERATATFNKQREILEEELSTIERKLWVVHRSLSSLVDHLASHLAVSAEAVGRLQKIMSERTEKSKDNEQF